MVTPLGAKETDYTKVTFEPDLARFKMDRCVRLYVPRWCVCSCVKRKGDHTHG